jgi:hypothetical protein
MNVGEWVTVCLECVCVWVRENSPPHLCLWVRERPHLPSALPSNHISDNLLINRILDGRTDGHTRFSAQTLNPDTPKRIPWQWGIPITDTPKRIPITLCDTHYTERYPLWTHPRGYPLHCVIPITDTPKKIPITPSDTHYGHTQEDTHYTDWYPLRTHPRGYPYPEFSEPTQEFTHYTEGPYFPHKQTGHWVIPMTPRDTPDTEWYPLPWVLANRIWLGKDCCFAEFQHFILRCIKISLLCGYHWKRG